MEISCFYLSCPYKNKPIKQVFLCTKCKEVIYCSKECLDNDWIEVHSQVCLTNSKGVSLLKFNFGDFSDLYPDKPQENELSQYGIMGNSRLVKHIESKKPFVLKKISKKTLNEVIKGDFANFYKSIRELRYPHLLRTFHFNEDDKNVYLILECAKNGSLKDLIKENKKIYEDQAFAFFCQCCLGLEYLHSKDLFHGEFNSTNILLSQLNNVKLCDYGYNIQNIILKKNISSNLEYIPPELIKNNLLDKRGDIWGLGILLYELLHGNTPFWDENYKKIFDNIVQYKKIPFDSKISDEVVDLIQNLLNKNPINRLTLPKIYEHPWIQKYERFFEVSINNFRNKLKSYETEGKKLKDKQNYENKEEMQNLLEEGFSPENSPTRKLKKKVIFQDDIIKKETVPDKENITLTETEEKTPEIFIQKSDTEQTGNVFEKVLRKVGNFCNC